MAEEILFTQDPIDPRMELGDEDFEFSYPNYDDTKERIFTSRAAFSEDGSRNPSTKVSTRNPYGIGVTVIRKTNGDRTEMERRKQAKIKLPKNPLDSIPPPVVCTGCGKRINWIKLHRLLFQGRPMREAMDESGAVRICCSATCMEDPETVEYQKILEKQPSLVSQFNTLTRGPEVSININQTVDAFTPETVKQSNAFIETITGRYTTVNSLYIPGLRDPLFDQNGFIGGANEDEEEEEIEEMEEEGETEVNEELDEETEEYLREELQTSSSRASNMNNISEQESDVYRDMFSSLLSATE